MYKYCCKLISIYSDWNDRIVKTYCDIPAMSRRRFLSIWESVSKEVRDYFFRMMDYSNTFYWAGTLRNAFVYLSRSLRSFNAFYWLSIQWWMAYNDNESWLKASVYIGWIYSISLRWRHNGRDGVSNHQPHDCLLNYLFRRRSKENIKATRHWPLCGEFTGDRWIPRTNGQ